MVVMLAWTVRAGGDRPVFGHKILAKDHIRFQCLKRIHKYRQFFILYFDGFNAISSSIAVFGHNKSNLLPLKQHLAIGQNHLLVTGQRRHPVQAQRTQIVGCQHRQNAGHLECRILVDAFHPRMRIGRADKVAKQHAVQFDIIDVVAFALRKPGILYPLARAAHAFEVIDPFFACDFVFHSAASLAALIWAAAA